jgi:hypothetical protein
VDWIHLTENMVHWQSHETSGSITGGIDQLSEFQLLKNDSAPGGYAVSKTFLKIFHYRKETE